MVQVCSKPPTKTLVNEIAYGDRYINVPAMKLTSSASAGGRRGAGARGNAAGDVRASQSGERIDVPLVIPLDKGYSPSGAGVVSARNTEHFGYNGFDFCKLRPFPELWNDCNDIVQRSWLPGLLTLYAIVHDSGEPLYREESINCAPEN